MSFSPFLLLYHLSLFAVHFFSIAPKNGNKKSETLANGVVSTYDYNNANRIVKLVNKKGNSTISEYEYSYYLDGSDACKKTTENGIIETTEYEYDGLKRLTEESVAKGSNTDTYS